MLALPIIGCLITACTNYLGSRIGYSNFSFADKDILFPLSTALFLFYSLLIYVPEVHGKLVSLETSSANLKKQIQAEQQEEEFPIAFLFGLLAITLAVLLDRFYINKVQSIRNEEQRNLNNHPRFTSSQGSSNDSIKSETCALKYFLSLSLFFVNIFSSYFITRQYKESSIFAELLIFLVFSFLLNYAYGFLLAWSEIEPNLSHYLMLFVNSGLIAGFILALIVNISSAIVLVPCFSIGFAIYTAVFVCLPKIFTNGEKPVQDKFRFWAIFIAFLITVMYYPIAYLLKI